MIEYNDSLRGWRIRNDSGQYLVMPVRPFGQLKPPEWTDIPECGYHFTKQEAVGQQFMLSLAVYGKLSTQTLSRSQFNHQRERS